MTVATSLADVLPAEALSAGRGGPGVAFDRPPEAVVQPGSTEEVATILEWASAHGLGVLTVASGQRVPHRPLDRPFVLLRMERLRGIEIYEPADLTLTARAGTPLTEIADRVGAHRQWLPFDPPNVGERSLGGLVASGESGPAWMGYGELRNHVLGMTIVTGDGRTLRLGGRVVKNVAGFDLIKPMVGSRGGLSVITSVCIRAFPRPAEDRLLVLRADTASELREPALAVSTAPVLPVSSVLLAPARTLGAGAALLVRLHGAVPTVDADQRALERHCGVSFERPAEAAAAAVEARDAACGGPGAVIVNVLPSRLGEALAAIRDARPRGDATGELVADAYAGFIRATGVPPEAVVALQAAVVRVGGAVAVLGAPAAAASPEEAELVSGLIRVFDPNGVLWPCRG